MCFFVRRCRGGCWTDLRVEIVVLPCFGVFRVRMSSKSLLSVNEVMVGSVVVVVTMLSVVVVVIMGMGVDVVVSIVIVAVTASLMRVVVVVQGVDVVRIVLETTLMSFLEMVESVVVPPGRVL